MVFMASRPVAPSSRTRLNGRTRGRVVVSASNSSKQQRHVGRHGGELRLPRAVTTEAPSSSSSTSTSSPAVATNIKVDLIDLGSVSKPSSCNIQPKKTHIVCTLGPSTHSVAEIEQLLHAGMSVARFNFSHGTHEYHLEALNNLREAAANVDKVCAVLLDTKGPEIRTGFLRNNEAIQIDVGAKVTLTSDYEAEGYCENGEALIAMSYEHIARDLVPGGQVLMADGAVLLRVDTCDAASGLVHCTALNCAKLGERKNCNLPDVEVDLPTLTEKDVHDLVDFGVKHGVDFIAASFVRKGEDVKEVRKALGEEGSGIRVISKVENAEGLKNFDEILEESDGIMVARGDLGMEIATEKIFWVQKVMIRKCNIAGKPVVTATQMLDSMIQSPRPTRAEATDVANAVLDGTDCVMLSGETAAGSYPIEAVTVMGRICEEAESCIDNYSTAKGLLDDTMEMAEGEALSVIESLASSAVGTAKKIDAKLIVVLAANGSAARLIAKYRPEQPIVVGVVPRERRDSIGFSERKAVGSQVVRQCLLTRGLIPVEVERKQDQLDAPSAAKKCLQESIDYAIEKGLCQRGDPVVAMYNVEKQCAVVRCMEA